METVTADGASITLLQDTSVNQLREHYELGITTSAARKFIREDLKWNMLDTGLDEPEFSIDELESGRERREREHRQRKTLEEIRPHWGYTRRCSDWCDAWSPEEQKAHLSQCTLCDKDSWIMDAFPETLTCYDLIACVRKWLVQNDAANMSVCEVLQARGCSSSVGKAECFMSHVQAEHPRTMIDAMIDHCVSARRLWQFASYGLSLLLWCVCSAAIDAIVYVAYPEGTFWVGVGTFVAGSLIVVYPCGAQLVNRRASRVPVWTDD